MVPYTIVTGDATHPHGAGPKLIAHICNDAGRWGKGFTHALSRRWARPEASYRQWRRNGPACGFILGGVQVIKTAPDIWVANMIAQHGTGPDLDRQPPIRYDALETCLGLLPDMLPEYRIESVHMPRIGCGLAGGTWDRVGPIVERTLCAADIPVTVYDPPETP